MQNQRKQLTDARIPFQGLTKDQIRNVVELTEEMKLKNKEQEKNKQVDRRKDNGFEL